MKIAARRPPLGAVKVAAQRLAGPTHEKAPLTGTIQLGMLKPDKFMALRQAFANTMPRDE